MWARGTANPVKPAWFKLCHSTLNDPMGSDCAMTPWIAEAALFCCGVTLQAGCDDQIWPTADPTTSLP